MNISNNFRDESKTLGIKTTDMVKFGKWYPHRVELNRWGKLGFKIFGYPFVGGYIRGLYFQKDLNKLDFKTIKNVCDAGCGMGEFSLFLAENYPHLKIDAFDINSSDIQKNTSFIKQTNIKNVSFFTQDLFDFNQIKKYDLIFSSTVLGIMSAAQNKDIFKKIHQALVPGGYFYLQIPSSPQEEITIFNPKNYEKSNESVKYWSSGEIFKKKELEDFTASFGFKIITSHRMFGFPGRLAWEIDSILSEKKYGKIKLLTLPILKVLSHIDIIIKHTKGNGIAILAQKTR